MNDPRIPNLNNSNHPRSPMNYVGASTNTTGIAYVPNQNPSPIRYGAPPNVAQGQYMSHGGYVLQNTGRGGYVTTQNVIGGAYDISTNPTRGGFAYPTNMVRGGYGAPMPGPHTEYTASNIPDISKGVNRGGFASAPQAPRCGYGVPQEPHRGGYGMVSSVPRGAYGIPQSNTPNMSRGGYHDPSAMQRGGYHDPSAVQRGGYHDPSAVQRGGYHDPSAVQRGGYHDPSSVQRGGYHDPSAVQRGGYHDPSAVQRGGYHDPSSIHRGGYNSSPGIARGAHNLPPGLRYGNPQNAPYGISPNINHGFRGPYPDISARTQFNDGQDYQTPSAPLYQDQPIDKNAKDDNSKLVIKTEQNPMDYQKGLDKFAELMNNDINLTDNIISEHKDKYDLNKPKG